MNQRYLQLKSQIAEHAHMCGRDLATIRLIAVTKEKPLIDIQACYAAGCRDFGESRVQEALPKIALLAPDCHWHFIGTLQRNKASKVLSSFCLIHSIDTIELLLHINQLNTQRDQITSVLLQVNVSGEGSKHGLSANQWQKEMTLFKTLTHIHIKGLMTIAPLTEDQSLVRACFRQLRHLRDQWRPDMPQPEIFQDLSMGMSNDYLLAIEEGATLLRIGSAIFT